MAKSANVTIVVEAPNHMELLYSAVLTNPSNKQRYSAIIQFLGNEYTFQNIPSGTYNLSFETRYNVSYPYQDMVKVKKKLKLKLSYNDIFDIKKQTDTQQFNTTKNLILWVGTTLHYTDYRRENRRERLQFFLGKDDSVMVSYSKTMGEGNNLVNFKVSKSHLISLLKKYETTAQSLEGRFFGYEHSSGRAMIIIGNEMVIINYAFKGIPDPFAAFIKQLKP